MTANVNDLLVVVVCFCAVTKPASIYNHKKFRNHENDSFLITRQSLIGVLILTLLFKYPYFFGGFSADKNSAANSAIGEGLGVYYVVYTYNNTEEYVYSMVII